MLLAAQHVQGWVPCPPSVLPVCRPRLPPQHAMLCVLPTALHPSLTMHTAGYQEYQSESYSVIGVPPGRCGMMHAPPPSALHMDPLSSLGLLLAAALAGERLSSQGEAGMLVEQVVRLSVSAPWPEHGA